MNEYEVVYEYYAYCCAAQVFKTTPQGIRNEVGFVSKWRHEDGWEPAGISARTGNMTVEQSRQFREFLIFLEAIAECLDANPEGIEEETAGQ